jgi:hypothetical protein
MASMFYGCTDAIILVHGQQAVDQLREMSIPPATPPYSPTFSPSPIVSPLVQEVGDLKFTLLILKILINFFLIF